MALTPTELGLLRRALKDRQIVLGITGGIAAYKVLRVIRALAQAGARVTVLLTRSALDFVTPLSIRTLSGGGPVLGPHEPFLPEGGIAHVELAHRADAILIAPLTAHTLARLSLGLADDLLTQTVLASRAPLILAPAMETHMWEHPATREHLERLRARGAVLVEPEAGPLASGRQGAGRLAAEGRILAALTAALGRSGDLAGRRVLVTAGGTREPLDPIRFLGNRSSGRMGVALAAAARDRGARVTLIHGHLEVPVPPGVEAVPAPTAAEMATAVLEGLERTDLLVMAAAVADYRPARVEAEKIKKGKDGFVLPLERTPDVLAAVAERLRGATHPPIRIGFAAETGDPRPEGRRKLREKGLDWLVANDAREVMGAEEARVWVLGRDGTEVEIPRADKGTVAHRIWDVVLGRG